jgi:hypothetical protein
MAAKPIFIVVATKGTDRIFNAIERLQGAASFEIKPDTWLVQFDGTTRGLAETLGIRDGTNGSGFVAPISGYGGRASSDLWEWLKVKWPEGG